MPQSPLVSSAVVWQIVRNGTSFSRKSTVGNKDHFTVEPNNVSNLNSKKFSGFGNDNVVGVRVHGNKGQQLRLVNTTNGKPRSGKTYNLRLNKKRSAFVASGKIHAVRPDLSRVALTRIGRISKSESARLRRQRQKKDE